MPETSYDITQPYLDIIKRARPDPAKQEEDLNVQRRIAKGNAVAEAFRLLMDYSGAKKGADVEKRTAPANAVMGAVEKYYKEKDQNKAEQQGWDKMELGAGLDALKSKSAQDYANEKQNEQNTFTAGENQKNRDADANRIKQNADQFRQEFGLKKEAEKNKTAVDYAQIEQQRERYRNTRPYGAEKGIYISDPDIQKQVHIPDDKRAQILAFIEADPNVKDEIPVMKLRFGNVPPETQAEFLVADLYSALTPETRAKIRQFSGETSTPTIQSSGQKPGDEFLFYKNTPQSQTPTIKKDKGSTMVSVEEPTQSAAQATPEQVTYLQGIAGSKQSPEWKRSAIYKYLTEQGYDSENAKTVAESAYQRLTGK